MINTLNIKILKMLKSGDIFPLESVNNEFDIDCTMRIDQLWKNGFIERVDGEKRENGSISLFMKGVRITELGKVELQNYTIEQRNKVISWIISAVCGSVITLVVTRLIEALS